MEDFQTSLLRLMTSSLTESERIQLIGQLQFAIVLLQKQQQQYEDKREKERNLQIAELSNRANGLGNDNQQQGQHQYSQRDGQMHQSEQQRQQKQQQIQHQDQQQQPPPPQQQQHPDQRQHQRQQENDCQQQQRQHQHPPPSQQEQQQSQQQQQQQQQRQQKFPQQQPQQAKSQLQQGDSQTLLGSLSTSLQHPQDQKQFAQHPRQHVHQHQHQHVVHQTQQQQQAPQPQQQQQQHACRPSECIAVLGSSNSIITSSDEHNLDLQLKLDLQSKEVHKHETGSMGMKCQESLHAVMSAPPQQLLQQRDEDTTTFSYFQNVSEADSCARNQAFSDDQEEVAGHDPLDNFDQSDDRWNPHKVEVQLHETAVTTAEGAMMGTVTFCPSEIEVVQLASAKSADFDAHGCHATTPVSMSTGVRSEPMQSGSSRASGSTCTTSLDGDSSGGDRRNARDQLLLPPLYSSDPTLPSFPVSPRDNDDDPLLAPITLETEEMAVRSEHVSEPELGDQHSDVGPSVEASDFPPLRVSLRSKRKARKPRRMTPQEDIEEDDLLSPYHVCPVCDLVWRRTNDYVCHLISHSPAPVTCAQCKGTFENTALLRSHECFDASQSLFFRRLCGYCGTGFVNKKAFNRHKRTAHAFVTAISCSFCQRTFYDSRPYYVHLETMHVAKGWRVCRKCGHIVENDAALRHHTRTSHSRAMANNSAAVNSAAVNGSGLAGTGAAGGPAPPEVKMVETAVPAKVPRSRRLPFKCSYCTPKRSGGGGDGGGANAVVAFATRAALREHVNKFHQNRCDDCGKCFRSAQALQKHRNASHNPHSAAKRRRVASSLSSSMIDAKDGIAAEMELAHHVLDQEDEEDENVLLEDDDDVEEEEEDDDEEEDDEEEGDDVAVRGGGRGAGSDRRKRSKPLSSRSSAKSTNQRRAARSRARARRQCQQHLNGYKCRFCTTRFHTYSVYREHLQLNHSDQVKTSECRDCQQVFLSQASLEKHRLTRTHRQRAGEERLERQHLCELCGKNYLRLQALQRHMKTHINDYEFCCPHCDFKAVEKSNLKSHLSRHFDLKPFACDKCDAKFTSRRSLKDHFQFKHSDSRDFFCETCGMGFKTLGTLSRHKKGHSTEKPYVCYCGVQFNRLSNLRRHLKSVHQTDDNVLPVKRLKKFTNGVDSVQLTAPSQQNAPPPPLQQQPQQSQQQPQQQHQQQQQQLVSIHMPTQPSPPPASVMHNMHPLPVSPPTAQSSLHHHSHVEAPRTPELPETDDDSTHAVLHSFLTSTADQPHISAPPSVAPNPADDVTTSGPLAPLLVHQQPVAQAAPSGGPQYCCAPGVVSGVVAHSVSSTATAVTPASTGPMMRSLVGQDEFGGSGPGPGQQQQQQQQSAQAIRPATSSAPSLDHIWRPMGSVHEAGGGAAPPHSAGGGEAGGGGGPCTIVSSVNCVLDSGGPAGNPLPFDDVLWSSAVLPQTAASTNVNSGGGGSITYLLSGGASTVSLVGQSEAGASPMLFSGGGGPPIGGGGGGGPVTSSGGELTSTLMISHLASDPLGLHSLTGSLVSPTLQAMGVPGAAGEGQHHHQLHHSHLQHHQQHHQHHQHQQQQPAQPQQPQQQQQCSDFSVCYLIGSQNHVK